MRWNDWDLLPFPPYQRPSFCVQSFPVSIWLQEITQFTSWKIGPFIKLSGISRATHRTLDNFSTDTGVQTLIANTFILVCSALLAVRVSLSEFTQKTAHEGTHVGEYNHENTGKRERNETPPDQGPETILLGQKPATESRKKAGRRKDYAIPVEIHRGFPFSRGQSISKVSRSIRAS